MKEIFNVIYVKYACYFTIDEIKEIIENNQFTNIEETKKYFNELISVI